MTHQPMMESTSEKEEGYEGEDDKEETEGEGKGEDKEKEVDEEHAEEEIYSFHLYPKILGL